MAPQLKKKVTLRTKSPESLIEEEPKQKVTLKKKQPDVSQEPVSVPPTPTPEPVELTGGGGKGKWIAAALAGLLAVGGGGYYLSQQDKDNTSDPQVEVVNDGTVSEKGSDPSTLALTDNNDGQDEGATQTGDQPNVDEQKVQGGDDAASPSDGKSAPAQKPAEDKVTSPAKATQDKPNAETAKQPSSQTPSSATGSKPGSATAPSAASTAGKATASTSSSTSAATSSSTSTASKESVSAGAPTGSIEDLALEVIRGKYGNNPDRRRLLGSRYKEIQRRVNEMYRKGLVH